ncbi:RNA methyltransferase, RsmD family [Thiovulum sp. ES]|nr:RNA methyltransferase, RsmD family [Thiovulum sp. ES]
MKNSIKIDGGKYKGQKIELPNIETTRPSKSIVRNSIFDTLQTEIAGRDFVELFAGSGSVGFEALSRGANRVFFFEQNREALKTLKRNQRNFSEEIQILEGDSFQNFSKISNELEDAILYIDPPFSIREGMENIYQKTIELFERPHRNIGILIFEHLSSEKFPEKIGELEKVKSKKFGKTTLSYYS